MSERLYHERGRRLLSWREVLNQHARLLGRPGFAPPRRWYQVHRWFRKDEALIQREPGEPHFYWSGLALPWRELTSHFLILGATGSGKTLLQLLMLKNLLGEGRHRPDQRALLYDAKNELQAWLEAQGIEPLRLDPFDERSVAPDFAADVQTMAQAQQMAAILIVAPGDTRDTFWIQATRAVLAGVILALALRRPGRWTLRDVLLVMRSAAHIERLLGQFPDTAHLWRNCRGEAKTEANLMASFGAQLTRYEVLAALWDRARRKISLRDWASQGRGVLLLPNHPRYREVLAPLHRLLLQILAEEVLSQPDNPTRRTIIALDELRNLGKVESLYALANEGRSKGACLICGSQSVEGLQEVYGEKVAQEILGQLRSKVFLRTDSAHTARWMEQHLGQVQYAVENIATTSGMSGGKSSSSTTTSHSRRRESLLLASEFMSLPTPRPGGRITLINDLPSVGGCFLSAYPFEQLLREATVPGTHVPNFIERPRTEQRLRPFTAAELRTLRLDETAGPPPRDTVSNLLQELQNPPES